MESPPPPERPPATLMNWLALAFVLLGSGGYVALSLSGGGADAIAADPAAMFGWRVIATSSLELAILAFLAATLQLSTEGSLDPLGLPGDRSWRAAWRTLGIGVAVWIFLSFVLPNALIVLFPDLPSYHPDVLAGAIDSPGIVIRAILLGLIAGALREELWRVVFLRACERVAGSYGLWAGIGLNALLFGVVHLYEGFVAVGVTAILGAGLGIRWAIKRDLPELVGIHACFNIMTVLFLYISNAFW